MVLSHLLESDNDIYSSQSKPIKIVDTLSNTGTVAYISLFTAPAASSETQVIEGTAVSSEYTKFKAKYGDDVYDIDENGYVVLP